MVISTSKSIREKLVHKAVLQIYSSTLNI